jgi:hypothetical protein
METVVETKASTILQFLHGLRGELHVTWEEGTWAAWLYDLLQPQVQEVALEWVEWCPETELNRHVPFGTRDFKSRASASFAIRAGTKPLKRIYQLIP